MHIDELSYVLPEQLVARYPSDRRDRSRLMRVGDEALADHLFCDLPELLPAGALLVVNDTQVRWARLLGQRDPSGGRVEVLLVELQDDGLWQAMARSSKRLRAGSALRLGETLRAEVVAGTDVHGLLRLRLHTKDDEPIEAALAREGHVPLPPYLRRQDEPLDRQRYQTMFAQHPGAVAAPTAGLHFTPELMDALQARGVERASITLHVGPGTFRPVTSERLDEHPMHSERIVVPPATERAIAQARGRGAPVVAVGTTVVRALESAADPTRPGCVRARAGETELLIQPGYCFRVIDALITNFHLPRSTLLALVYAFAGRDRARRAYEVAVERSYRFYSYGDAMLIPRCHSPGSRPAAGNQEQTEEGSR